jgi:RNA polymerase sigma factor (sigma-70 family)
MTELSEHQGVGGLSNESLLLGWRDRWNRKLLQFLGRRVRARVDVEDLAQETYLRLLRAPDLTEVRNPQAYLFRVASHVVSEWRNRLAPMEPLSEENDGLLIDECVPELDLDASLSQERVNRTLAEMSPLMRAVLLLRVRDNYSYMAIAEELNITRRQVHRYMARGYDKLRNALED